MMPSGVSCTCALHLRFCLGKGLESCKVLVHKSILVALDTPGYCEYASLRRAYGAGKWQRAMPCKTHK